MLRTHAEQVSYLDAAGSVDAAVDDHRQVDALRVLPAVIGLLFERLGQRVHGERHTVAAPQVIPAAPLCRCSLPTVGAASSGSASNTS